VLCRCPSGKLYKSECRLLIVMRYQSSYNNIISTTTISSIQQSRLYLNIDEQNIRSPSYLACNQTDNNPFNVSHSATLSITMADQPEVKSKRRTKYRPVQRSDGVIVLQRPYRPTTSSPPLQVSTFENHLPTFIVPASKATLNRVTGTKRVDEDLTAIGSYFPGMETNGSEEMVGAGRGCYQDLMEAGRGGYNDIFGKHDNMANFTEELRQPRTGHHKTPMQCFLSEPGPWSSLELRNV
jgi:hypothetical protein